MRIEHLTTLCYLEKDGKYLMMHRIRKKKDINKDKWIGVGGHFEQDESPEECICREVYEETGYHLTAWRYRGLVTFVQEDVTTEYMHLFTADGFEGIPKSCDEGVLEWVDKEEVWNLNLWEGDKIFFRLLDEEVPFFSLKLTYSPKGELKGAVLNGKPMELFDIVREDGSKTGVIKERGVAHRDGSLHLTAHIWLIRKNPENGYDILLQKRSQRKESFPGCFDVSSAGHVSSGDTQDEAARRELWEELGIEALPEELEPIGMLRRSVKTSFAGKAFWDEELGKIFVYEATGKDLRFQLQESEVDEVMWISFEEFLEKVEKKSLQNCIFDEEIKLLGNYINTKK